MKKMDQRINLSLFLLLLLSCKTPELAIKVDCFEQELQSIVNNDNLSKLHTTDKLCLILSHESEKVCAALIKKNNVTDYMLMYESVDPIGYFSLENTLVLVYGEHIEGLNINRDISKVEFDYNHVGKITPDINTPPPPRNIEPELNCYMIHKGCLDKIEEGTYLELLH